MYPNEFYAKTALIPGQIASKDRIGYDGLEYQLLPSDFTPEYRSMVGKKEKLILVEDHPASSVHPPLALSNADDILVPSDNVILYESMFLAQASAELRHDRCLVVVHVPAPPSCMCRSQLDDMERECERLLATFPDVDIVLENITPLRDFSKGLPELCNGYYDANVQLAERFSRFGDNGQGGRRVMTCLDICHARLSGFYLDALKSVYIRDPAIEEFPFDYSLRTYMEMNAPVIGLVHLASAAGNGYGDGHGVPFDADTGEEMDVLDEFFDLYDELGMSCPVTLEVREDDFLVSDNYEKSYHAVQHLLAKKRALR